MAIWILIGCAVVTLASAAWALRLRAQLRRAHADLARLADAQQSFAQALIDVIPQPVYVRDADSRFAMVNAAYAASQGFPAAQILGRRPGEVMRDEEREACIVREDGEVLAGARVYKEVVSSFGFGGEPRNLVVAKGTCRDARGQPVVVGTYFDVTRWREAERELQAALDRETLRRERTQAFIQRVIDLIPQPVYVKDAYGRFLMVNEAQVSESGASREQLLGLRSFEWMIGKDDALVSLVQGEDAEVLAGRVIHKEEHRPSPVSGEERHRLVSKASCLDADGNPVIVVANFNVTRWYQAERELTEALAREQENHERTQQYIQRLIDVLPYPVYVKDAESRFLLANQAFLQERQLSREAVRGRDSVTLEVSGADAVRSVREEDLRVLEGEVVIKEEYKPDPRTGQERYRVVAKSRCEDAMDNTVIVVASFDVTPWRVAERELAAALARETGRSERIQQYVQRLIDVIPQPVYVKDAKSRYVMVNEAMARERNTTCAALIGRAPADTEGGRQVQEEDARVLAGERVLKEEYKPVPQSGEARYRVIAKGSCLDDEGRPVIVGANFDVTSWRLAEARLFLAKEEAERANAAKSIFLTNMSHELRTPMHGVLSFARLGLERAPGAQPERLQGYFERILASGERLMALLDDLLDLAKLESGRMEVRLRPLPLAPLVYEVLAEFEALSATRQLRMQASLAELAPAEADSDLCRQVLRNLIANAIKFSPAEGEISVRLVPGWLAAGAEAAPRPAAELVVADRGPGIPENELEAVFDKFVQSSKTHSGAGGTGLGLAICREIVAAHHGEIFARNRTGGGAEFVLRLPLA